MSNGEYRYFKIKEHFYDSVEFEILKNVPEGYIYRDILMKLYCKDVDSREKRIIRDYIPYSPIYLAASIDQSIDILEKAFAEFLIAGLIDFITIDEIMSIMCRECEEISIIDVC